MHPFINKYLTPYKWTIALGALFLTAANFFLVWIPVLIRQTMDRVEQLNAEQSEVLSLFDTLFNSVQGSILATNALYLVAAVCGYGFFLFLTRQTLIVASRKVEYDLRNDVLHALFSLPSVFYAKFTAYTASNVIVSQYQKSHIMRTLHLAQLIQNFQKI